MLFKIILVKEIKTMARNNQWWSNAVFCGYLPWIWSMPSSLWWSGSTSSAIWKKKTIKVNKEYGETKKGLHITVKCFILAIYQHCILNLARILSQLLEWLFNNYPLSLNGLRVTIATEAKGQMGYGLRGHEDEGNNCLTKIQLVGQKYRDKTTLAS